MDVLRRNTDYALRLIANLTKNYDGKPLPARQLAKNCNVSYELACKLLQKLSSAKLVVSRMGVNGGFELAKKPEKINIYQVVAAIQGGVCLNRCIPNAKRCFKGQNCKIRERLVILQNYIEKYLSGIWLNELRRS